MCSAGYGVRSAQADRSPTGPAPTASPDSPPDCRAAHVMPSNHRSWSASAANAAFKGEEGSAGAASRRAAPLGATGRRSLAVAPRHRTGGGRTRRGLSITAWAKPMPLDGLFAVRIRRRYRQAETQARRPQRVAPGLLRSPERECPGDWKCGIDSCCVVC